MLPRRDRVDSYSIAVIVLHLFLGSVRPVFCVDLGWFYNKYMIQQQQHVHVSNQSDMMSTHDANTETAFYSISAS